MGKPKIYASGNENLSGDFNISYYIVEKEESFLDWLGALLVEVLDVSDGKMKAKFIINKDEGGNEEKIFPKNIDEMIDFHEHYSQKNERVDIFYGHKRIYITLRKSKEMRKKFADFILKTKDWITLEEIESSDMPPRSREINVGKKEK